MMDVFFDLSWQHQVLFFEMILSAAVGLDLAYRPQGFQRTRNTMMFFLAWNAVVFLLLVTGADDASWQHVTLFGWYLLDSFVVIMAGVQRRKTGPEKGPGAVAFVTTLTLLLLSLLVTG